MSNRSPLVESLESRRLFSSVAPVPTSHALVHQASSVQDSALAAHVAALKAAAKKTSQVYYSVKGDWHGEWEVDSGFFEYDYDIRLNFKSMSRDSKSASGTLSIEHTHHHDDDYSGTWSGITYGKTGEFNYTLKKHGDKIKIVGHLNSDSTAAWGYIRIDWKYGGYDKGDFHLHKH